MTQPHSRSPRRLRRTLIAATAAGAVSALGVYGAWWLRAHGLTLGEAATELRRGDDPRYDWRSVDKRHWQALSRTGGNGGAPAEEPAAQTDAREANGAGCPTGMVRVKGNYRVEHGEPSGEIGRIQDGACTDWISREFPARCRSFDADKIAAGVSKLPTRALDFCMDRFEYPNVLGQNPIIVVTFNEAENLCKKSKKRLCNENEWTFACEGEEVRPYPYGWTRDATACVVDRSWRPFKEGALMPRDGQQARVELDRLWQAEPSGSRGACKSPFGVYDMTGNVDEWTRSVRPTGFASILKGGYWGPVRARCRPATRAHNEDFVAYQQGFRCCGDANASVPPPPRVTPPVAAAATGAKRADATPPVSDRATEWPDPGETDQPNDDEIGAIQRARVKLGCAMSPGGSSGGPGAWAAAVGLAIASVLRAARRWRSPTTTTCSPPLRSRERAREARR